MFRNLFYVLKHLSYFLELPVMQIACGGNHSIVLTMGGTSYAFGKNTSGQLGIGDRVDRNSPVPIKSLWYKYIIINLFVNIKTYFCK